VPGFIKESGQKSIKLFVWLFVDKPKKMNISSQTFRACTETHLYSMDHPMAPAPLSGRGVGHYEREHQKSHQNRQESNAQNYPDKAPQTVQKEASATAGEACAKTEDSAQGIASQCLSGKPPGEEAGDQRNPGPPEKQPHGIWRTTYGW
jgi:hypothetical protein